MFRENKTCKISFHETEVQEKFRLNHFAKQKTCEIWFRIILQKNFQGGEKGSIFHNKIIS